MQAHVEFILDVALCVYFFHGLNHLHGFPVFDFESTRWRLSQKRTVRTKYDIYVFISAHDAFLE